MFKCRLIYLQWDNLKDTKLFVRILKKRPVCKAYFQLKLKATTCCGSHGLQKISYLTLDVYNIKTM